MDGEWGASGERGATGAAVTAAGTRGDGRAVSRRGFLRGAAGGSVAAAAGSGVAGAQEDEVRQVEMTDDLVYVPEEITVAPGDTVRWVNVGQIGHSVTAYEEEIPEAADYFASGGFENEQAARSAYPEGDIPGGESYEYTFEVAGSYGYFCIPHEAVGMIGTVEVIAGGGAGDGDEGGGGAGGALLPDAAKTIGVAAIGAMLSVLGLTYFLMKYGGDYREVE